jgi:hypothetical protein
MMPMLTIDTQDFLLGKNTEKGQVKQMSINNPTKEDLPGTSWFSVKMTIFLMCGSFSTEKGSNVFLFHSTRAALSTVTR